MAILLLACGLALGSAPCWAHNFLIAREPVILSAHSGVNFWIGNNPDATGYPHFPGLRAGQSEMLEDSIAVAEKEVGHPLLRSEVSAFWSAKARNYIQSDLWGWGKLLLTKAGNFWNAFEYDDLSVIRRLEDEGIVLPGGRFGLIAAFGIAGATLALQRYRRTRWIGAAVLLQMAAVLPVFVTERYRIVAVPGLLLFAGSGVVWLWHALVQFRWKAALGYLLLLAAATAFVSLPRTDPNLWALAAYNSGRQALERGDFAQAQAELLRARAYAPGNAEVSFVLGNVQLAKGDRLRARLYYNETLAADSSNKRALNNLGLIALDEGLPGEAESYLRRALREESNSATTHYLLARSLREQQKSEAAKVEIQEAIKLKPDQLEFNALRELIEKDSASAGER